MVDINNWVQEITQKLKNEFKEKLLFAGVQGSYRRNEATPDSDIDMVVILETSGLKELSQYKKIIQSMPENEKACGFICGKDELKNWSKYELFQLYNDTKAIYGDLQNLLPQISRQDAKDAAKIGAQNIYHMACHSFLHSQNQKESLKELYKGIVFVLQAKYYFENGDYILTKQELSQKLSGTEKTISDIAINKNNIDNLSEQQIYDSFELLINFCSKLLREYNQNAK